MSAAASQLNRLNSAPCPNSTPCPVGQAGSPKPQLFSVAIAFLAAALLAQTPQAHPVGNSSSHHKPVGSNEIPNRFIVPILLAGAISSCVVAFGLIKTLVIWCCRQGTRQQPEAAIDSLPTASLVADPGPSSQSAKIEEFVPRARFYQGFPNVANGSKEHPGPRVRFTST